MEFFYEGNVMWSQIDANMHLRHSAYADFAAQARLSILEYVGLNNEVFRESNVGPILFREELIYFREIAANHSVKIKCELTKSRIDASRWSFRHEIYRGDGIKAATVNVDGAWIDTSKRKLAVLPDFFIEFFNKIPKAADYVAE